MSEPKPLQELTEIEFNILKNSGLLKTIYPGSPEAYEDIRGKRPKPLQHPNFGSLVRLCEEYLDYCEDPDKHRMKDASHYIYEEVMKCIYGPNDKSGIWDFINKSPGGQLD